MGIKFPRASKLAQLLSDTLFSPTGSSHFPSPQPLFLLITLSVKHKEKRQLHCVPSTQGEGQKQGAMGEAFLLSQKDNKNHPTCGLNL